MSGQMAQGVLGQLWLLVLREVIWYTLLWLRRNLSFILVLFLWDL